MIYPGVFFFILGVTTVPFLRFLFATLIRFHGQHGTSKDRLYALDHGVLNLESPPRYMWMNLGFWKHSPIDFPSACKALLNEVLKVAEVGKNSSITHRKLIDLGFGCGDQTLVLAGYSTGSDRTHDPDISHTFEQKPKSHTKEPRKKPLFDSYVGVTLSESQFSFARERVKRLQHDLHAPVDVSRIQLYHADAAKPDQWSARLKQSINSIECGFDKNSSHEDATSETWLLGLDCLYHFKPSREPIFEHAFSELGASIMAFDLLMGDDASLFDRISLRIIALFGLAPYSNFLTQRQYEDQLVAAGYERESIEIQDISEHVFAGIASFLRQQDRRLGMIGMTIGKFKLAGMLFGWWARTRVIRGCVVVARK